MMTRNEVSIFFGLAEEEQTRLIEKAREDVIRRHGKEAYWAVWTAFQLAGIAALSFMAGFGIAAFLYLAGSKTPNYTIIGASLGLAVVLVGPTLSRRANVLILSAQIKKQLQNKIDFAKGNID